MLKTQTLNKGVVDWDPVNWFAAPWRDNDPLSKSPPRAFDLSTAKANVAQLVIDWNTAPWDMSMCKEEALFWFASCFGKGVGDTSRLAELQTAATAGGGKISLETMKLLLLRTRFDATDRAHSYVPIQVLETLMTPVDLATLLCQSQSVPAVQQQYRRRVVPFLSREDRKMVAQVVQGFMAKCGWRNKDNFCFYLGACLGLTEETLTLVSSWQENHGGSVEARIEPVQQIVFGLGSAELMKHHFKRLNLQLMNPDQVTCWIAHTEDHDLDVVWRDISRAQFGADATKMFQEVARMRSAPVADFMFDRFCEARYKEIAEKWLQDNFDLAVEATIMASSRNSKHADDALAYLSDIRRTDGDERLRKIADGLPAHAVRRLHEELLEPPGSALPEFNKKSTPEWLDSALTAEIQADRKKRLPAFVSLTNLPPVVIDQHKLNPTQIQHLFGSLQTAALDALPEFALSIKPHADTKVLDRFVWSVFDSWLRSGANTKDNWAIYSLGYLGSDALVPKLAQLLKTWPGENNHKRAVTGLDCLRIFGTDLALMQLNAIADKAKFKALKAKAEECMVQIAEARGLSRDRLADRIMPSFSFERGTNDRVFDFGPRKFTVTVGGDLKPIIVDESGKVREELPAGSSSDDAALANESTSEWKLLKKNLRDFYVTQTVRLEHAMILGRRWFTDEFVSFLLKQPLMPQLLRKFVWGGFDLFGKLKSSFVITESLETVDLSGAKVDLESFAEIGLLHPLQLSPAELDSWKEYFVQQNQIGGPPPFLQLERHVERLTEKEISDVEVLRARNWRIPAIQIVGALDKNGWQRGPVLEGGIFTEHVKHFPRADITAVICYKGIITGSPSTSGEQYIAFCAFLPGKAEAEFSREFVKGIKLGDVDAIVLSEVLADLERIKAKGKLEEK